MTDFKPKPATALHANSIVNLLVLAFSADPFMRWMYPDPQQYLTHRPTFFKIVVDVAIANESAYIVGDCLGAALWFPPEAHIDKDPVLTLLRETVDEEVLADLFAMIEQAETYHSDEPSWYLPLIGIDPIQRGQGYGSTLLRYSLQQCDRDHKFAYLDNTNPANIPLYERYGFEVLGTVQVGGSPPWFPMIRPPQ